jgi:hypothetical protein
MPFANLDGSHTDINGRGEGVSVAEAEPERNQTILDVFGNHFLEAVDI